MVKPATAPPKPDPELVRILHVAGSAARQSPRKQIDGAIILAAVIGDGKSSAAGLLKVHGLTFEETIRVLQRSFTQQAGPQQLGPQPSGAPPAVASRPSQAPVRPAPVVESKPINPPPPADPEMPTPRPVVPPPAVPVQVAAASSTPPPAIMQPSAALPSDVPLPSPLPSRPTPGQIAAASTDTLLASVRSRLQGDRPGVELPPVRAGGSRVEPMPTAMTGAERDVAVSAGKAGDTVVPTAAARPAAAPFVVPRGVAQPGAMQAPVSPPSTAPSSLPPSPPPSPSPGRPPPPESSRPPPPALNRPPVPFPQRTTPPGHAEALAGLGAGSSPRRSEPGDGGRPPGALPPNTVAPTVAYSEQEFRDRYARSGDIAGPPYPSPDDVEPYSGTVMPPRVAAPMRPTSALDLARAAAGMAKSMTVGVPSLVEVRIPRADVTGPVQRSQGSIEYAVSLRLKSMDGRSVIEPDTPELTWLSGGSPVNFDDTLIWRWRVTPRMKGRGRLHLQASVRSFGADGRAADIAVPDYIADIRMRPNRKASLLRVLGLVMAMLAGYFFAIFGERLLWSGVASVRRLFGF